MWNRKELKTKAKIAFKENYWRCVVVALIIAIILGTGSTATFKYTSNNTVTVNGQTMTADNIVDVVKETISDVASNNGITQAQVISVLGLVGAVVASVVALFAMIRGILKIFIGNIFEVGSDRFFIVNTVTVASISEIFHGFTTRYLRNVITLLLRTIYIALWSLLFVIPGIVKTYSYRLVPYILADDPEISCSEAFRLSRSLMRGNKWRAFVLDLSFIGWEILSAFTLGLLHIFYVGPYIRATNAELYRALITE